MGSAQIIPAAGDAWVRDTSHNKQGVQVQGRWTGHAKALAIGQVTRYAGVACGIDRSTYIHDMCPQDCTGEAQAFMSVIGCQGKSKDRARAEQHQGTCERLTLSWSSLQPSKVVDLRHRGSGTRTHVGQQVMMRDWDGERPQKEIQTGVQCMPGSWVRRVRCFLIPRCLHTNSAVGKLSQGRMHLQGGWPNHACVPCASGCAIRLNMVRSIPTVPLKARSSEQPGGMGWPIGVQGAQPDPV